MVNTEFDTERYETERSELERTRMSEELSDKNRTRAGTRVRTRTLNKESYTE